MVAFSKEELHQIREFFEACNRQEAQSKWQGLAPEELQLELIGQLEQGQDEDDQWRRLAYWALSKRFDKALTVPYQKWLAQALAGSDDQAVYQLMIGLDNLDEPIFDPARTGFASFEVELNRRDASRYLNQTSS